MKKLLADPHQMLGMCVAGMRAFFHTGGTNPVSKRAGRKGAGRAKAKQR
jgi:hypothetical protein